MFHRHLTFERYELALEEEPTVAERLRAQARRCSKCEAILAEGALSSVIASWTPPPSVSSPVDWRSALRRAIAPSNIPVTRRRAGGRWRIPAAGLATAGLLMVITVPAAATAGPDSPLYPVRGLQDDARYIATPRADRAKLEVDLASSYLWQARVSASHHDKAGYQASMDRFFHWSDKLKSDVRSAPTKERAQIRETVTAEQSLLPSLAGSGTDQGEATKAQNVLTDVQGESQQGSGDQQSGGG